MKHSTLRRYARLYRAASHYGADKILRRHLGVGEHFPLPLGLGHGVDFGQSRLPCDLHGIEPIYWACNADMHAVAQPHKPSVAIPHPLLLAAADHERGERQGTLIVGPPPGRENDGRLLRSLEGLGIEGGTILVKRRPGWESSMAFWRSQGYDAAIFGEPFATTYREMVDLFSRFERVVGCTVSSAVVFAAALGARATLLRDYSFVAYEQAKAEEMLAPPTGPGREFVALLAGENDSLKTARSRTLLGSELDSSPPLIRENIERAVAELRMPFNFPRRYLLPLRYLLQEAALLLDRPGIIETPLRERRKRTSAELVAILEMNEVDYWLNGRNNENLRFSPTPYVRGTTIPGNSPDSY